MWIGYAVLSAFFAGLTSILAKIGIKNTDSNVATAIRSVVIFIFSCFIVWIVGSFSTIHEISGRTLLFLVLSGLSTGASWLCYFKALQKGPINKVVVVDKSSIVLTFILAILLLKESFNLLKLGAIIMISLGIFLMVEKKQGSDKAEKGWLIYAILSAVFASLTSLLGKIGIVGVESNLGTTIRTFVVLIMSFVMVGVSGHGKELKSVDKKELLFICLSGLSTGSSWLCYYKALQQGVVSVVVPIDKLSVLITVIFSYFVFKEKLNKKGSFGLLMLLLGTILIALA